MRHAESRLRGRRICLACLLGIGVAACGKDNGTAGNPRFFCESLSGNGATVSASVPSGCLNGTLCSISNPERAADADLASFAKVNDPSAQTLSITATAPSGFAFLGGNQPGVMFLAPAGNTGALTVHTFLSGTEQEASDCAAGASAKRCLLGGTAGGNPYSYLSFIASKTFDAVQIVIGGGSAANGDIEIHEICSNGNSS